MCEVAGDGKTTFEPTHTFVHVNVIHVYTLISLIEFKSFNDLFQIFTTFCRKQMTTAIYQFLPVRIPCWPRNLYAGVGV